MDKKWIISKLKKIASENERGYIDFFFAPVIKSDEVSEKVIKGMVIKSDEIYKTSFSPIILIIEYFKDDNTEEQEMQKSEFFKINVDYSTILSANKFNYDLRKNIFLNNYSELAIIDLLRLLQNDDIIRHNIDNLQKKSILLEQVI